MKIRQSENEVKRDISQFLSWNHIPHWRQNSGGRRELYRNKKGVEKYRWFWFMQWLWPDKDEGLVFLDIGGMMPEGRYFEVEVKKTGERPTKAQYKTIDFINKHNGIALWADSLDMFIEKWNKLFWTKDEIIHAKKEAERIGDYLGWK